MRAVVFNGPFEVEVVTRPIPKIIAPTDAILKVSSTALCGSDLHYYRGHQKATPGFVCGHETVGHITALGSSVTNFSIGDHVIVPFSTACGTCFFCANGQSSRCSQGVLFGCITPSVTIDGGQAEYIRIPHAGSSLVKAPSLIPEDMLVLMADVFPTGYFAASRFLKGVPEAQQENFTAVILGCGPVGICAIASAVYLTGGKAKIFAVDSVPERLAAAEKLGAIPIALSGDPISKIKAASSGRGADVVMEVVGHADALELAFELIRPFGKISSVGVHNEQISFPGFALYSKNVTMAFGRCPVRSLFDEALAVYEVLVGKLRFLCEVKMPLEQAPEAFKLFEKQKMHKILFSL
ncbi:chaperonin 10-like protein [Halenospora varia]|nr:chaperonin 10-like protein [Halenospora varia]